MTGQNSLQSERKSPYVNNLCAVLIMLTVAGNFIDLCTEGSGVSQSLFLFIYSFHMPLLIFLAGSVCRETVKDRHRTFRGVAWMFFLYLSLKVILWLVRLMMGQAPHFTLLSESSTPWLFFSLGVYLVLAYFARNVNKKFLLVLSLAFALLCGYNTSIGDYLVASRTLVFLPFFLLGQMCDMERVKEWTGSRRVRIAGFCVLALALLAMLIFREQLYVLRPMFTGRNSYKSLGKSAQVRWAYRLAAYAISTALSAVVLTVTPRKDLARWISRMGERFLPVYFWYRPALYVLTGLKVYERLDRMLGWRMGRVAWVLCGVIVLSIFASAFWGWMCDRFFKPLLIWEEECRIVFLQAFRSGRESARNRLWQACLAVWESLQGWERFLFYVVVYTVLFVIICRFVFADFTNADKTFIWTTDSMPLDFTRLVYISKTIRQGIASFLNGEGWNLPIYDFALGIGKQNLQLDPLSWLSILFPWDKIDVFFDLWVLARYYLIGLSFSIFGFYFHQKPLPVMIGAISYTFCGFCLYAGVRHPTFLDPAIYLPLLIIGEEEIIRNKKPYLFILITFTAIISYVYFACMLAVLAFIYAIVRILNVNKKYKCKDLIKIFGNILISGGTGIALSGVVLIPSLLQLLESSRIGKSLIWDSGFYEGAYYSKFLADFLVIPGDIGHWTCLGLSILTIPCLFILFFQRERKDLLHKSLRQFFLIFTLMLIVPAVSYIMSGFNTLSNRWCFGYAFICAAILMFEIPYLLKASKGLLILTGIGAIVYFIICYFVIDHDYYSEGVFVLLATVLFFLAMCFLDKRIKAVSLPCCLIITCFSVWYSSYLMYDPEQKNYVSEFASQNTPYKYLEQSQWASFAESQPGKEDDTFYRVDGDNITVDRVSANSAFYYDLWGLSQYSATSILYSSYIEWYKELECPQYWTINSIYAPIGPASMLTLSAVKYYLMRAGGYEIVPYGFKVADRIQNGKNVDLVLKNQYSLPMGYTYDTYLLYEDYNDLSALDKQEAQLQSVVLKKDPESSSVVENDFVGKARQVPFDIKNTHGVHWEDGELKVSEAGATMELTFEGLPGSETYLRVVNLDLTSGSSGRNWGLSVSSDHTSALARFWADASTYTTGMKTQLLCLGYSEEGYTSFTLTFPSKGTFILDDLQIWCQPMNDYAQQVQNLREETLENIEVNWRGLAGTISTSKDKILCFSIPYDRGWSAYVDGQKTDILQANTAFMAIEIEEGDHRIELEYCPPGMRVGIVLSFLGLTVLICIALLQRRKTIVPCDK